MALRKRSALMQGVLGIAFAILVPLSASPTPKEPPSPAPSSRTDYDQPPRLKRLIKPSYPKAAFHARIEGTVLVQITIDERGRVSDATVIKSIPALDAAALRCVRQWRFEPARKAGKPVATRAQAPVTFRLFKQS